MHGTVDEVAAQLEAIMQTTGAEVLNLRVHVPGIQPEEVIRQIGLLGEALPLIRTALVRSARA
ncbi:MAG: hypothetical protein E6G39_08280 [Actinobacteria bacterium]|nr:MAG: hypothetical protein E6G39_08280 [Actinomycetota bacterium]